MKSKTVTLRVPQEVYDKIKKNAESKYRTASRFIVEVLIEHLEKEEVK